LDPFVDLDSIRVDGYGPATITDIRTDLVPRREQLEDILSDTDEASDSFSDASFEADEIKETKTALRQAKDRLSASEDLQRSAVSVLGFLDQYGKSVDSKKVEVSTMTDFITLYRDQRSIENERHQKAKNEMEIRTKEIRRLEKKLLKLQLAEKNSKEARELRRQRREKNREKQRQRSERQRAQDERRKFWTPQVSTITVSLDGNSVFTPGSSRRNSITSQKQPDLSDKIRLLLVYVVPRANWEPRYELSFKTPTSSAKLTYRAEFENSSSELWQNAKVSLSTSQTSFSGISDKIPTLEAWHIKLVSADHFRKSNVWEAGLQSQKETFAKQSKKKKVSLHQNATNINVHLNHQSAQQTSLQSFGRAGNIGQSGVARPVSLFGSLQPPPNPAAPVAAAPGSLFGSRPSRRQASALGGGGGGGSQASTFTIGSGVPSEDVLEDDGDGSEGASDSETLPVNPLFTALEHQESVRQDYGLTTTYDLPGQRTLVPSSIKRKHVLAEIDLTAVTLSYMVVPKLRAAAFLKARIRNISSTTLLSGKAGMTVDGTFLGSTNLPSCAPDEFLSLSLGVDPSILVNYAKPTVRRATTGFFNKEDSAIFTRNCWLKNTKSSVASITVLDQIPISEDERLKVHIVEPKGLEKSGDRVKLDLSTKVQPQGAKAEVHLEKNGVVRWDVTLEKGKEAKLVLEYVTRLPNGQGLVGLD
jgi:hypothetical protein